MTVKPTPPPWRWSGKVLIGNDRQVLLASLDGAPSEADARLLAAAPELLELVKHFAAGMATDATKEAARVQGDTEGLATVQWHVLALLKRIEGEP